MSTFEAALAALSANTYVVGRSQPNLAPLPTGATRLDHYSDPNTGFETSVYAYGGKTVIAYAGTLPGMLDYVADASLAFGIPDSQSVVAASRVNSFDV